MVSVTINDPGVSFLFFFFGLVPLQFWGKVCRRNYRRYFISLFPIPFFLYSLFLSSKLLFICFWNWGHWLAEQCLHTILHLLGPSFSQPRGYHTDIHVLSMVNCCYDQKLYSMLCGDLSGKEIQKRVDNVYSYLIHLLKQRKLTQHCKATIL